MALALWPCTSAMSHVSVPLNDDWKFIRKNVEDAYRHTTDVSEWSDISLPHTWNATDGQDGGNNYYRGTCWYRKKF